jgi:hypothetical protein
MAQSKRWNEADRLVHRPDPDFPAAVTWPALIAAGWLLAAAAVSTAWAIILKRNRRRE